MARLAIRFCGSCNPHIDLARLGAHLRAMSGRRLFEMVPSDAGEVDLLVLLCGCPRACATKQEASPGVRRTLLIAGASLDGEAVPESDLPLAIDRELAACSR